MSAKTELKIEGMTCNHCAQTAAEALRSVSGVSSATVDLAKASATVTWSTNATPENQALLKAVESAGYEPSIVQPAAKKLVVKGMDCQNCVRHVTEAARSVSGVTDATADLQTGLVKVSWQPDATQDFAAVAKAIEKAGYEPHFEENKTQESAPKVGPLSGWKLNVVVGGSVTLLLMICEWVFNLGMTRWYQWFAFALVTPVQFICGARFYKGAWNQLKQGRSNMDTLVSLGSTTAYTYSTWGLLAGWHSHLYFMESSGIIALISIGHWLEAMMSEHAASSLKSLMNLAPPEAIRVDKDGKETKVAVSELRVDDQVRLRPGDRVPTDGEVVEGGSAVNESMLTGESLPVEKDAGSALYAGTMVDNGKLLMRVTKTGEDTALAQIIAVVERAQGSRAQIQKLGDQVSSVFVPIVVLIAIGTALWWGLAYDSASTLSHQLSGWLWPVTLPEVALTAAVIHAAAVLIIACPCAMGLATPAAIMAGTNAAAKRGILIRDGSALEKSGTITAVIFDKTGTLTEGKPSVVHSEDFREEAQQQKLGLKQLAVALTAASNHPLSLAVAALLEDKPKANVNDWQEHRGKGIEAKLPDYTNETVRLGSLRWLKETGADVSVAEAFSEKWMQQGATVLGIAEGKKLAGALALRDELKPKAKEVITQLHQHLSKGNRQSVYLLTGDSKVTAAALAAEAGIATDNVFAEVKPEEKADIVKRLQDKGQRVAFVGDGINDAPALEQADLGIAVSRASDVAREAADIILLKSDIQAIPEAIGLAQATLRTIKQNLFWAFFYNAAAIPLAALGFLSPLLSAAAMGFSDVIVIGNALRLRGWKR